MNWAEGRKPIADMPAKIAENRRVGVQAEKFADRLDCDDFRVRQSRGETAIAPRLSGAQLF